MLGTEAGLFARRLRWFVIAVLCMAFVIVARLVEIQVVRADEYEALADRMLTQPLRYIRAPRGSILDRAGRPLGADVPTSDVAFHYDLLGAFAGLDQPEDTRRYVEAVARRMRRRGDYPAETPLAEAVADVRREIEASLESVCAGAGVTRDDIRTRCAHVLERIERWRAAVERASNGLHTTIAEQSMLHPVVDDVDAATALRLRIDLERLPWLRIVPSAQRVAQDADSLSHLLGRLGAADERRIEEDPLADDELRRLTPGSQCGISGVERLAEAALRGARGRIEEDFDHDVIERVEPQAGRDVRLTIELETQQRLYEIMETAVKKSPHPCGGSAVVIDVATRDVVALISYPSYAYDEFGPRYDDLRRDTRWTPTLFRAVRGQYPPGSTCKIATLYGALADGKITTRSTIRCDGVLNPEKPDRFRCWIYNQYGATHGPQDAEHAIRNSCNIFLYRTGERLGPDGLCRWFSRFGLGRLQGTGLIEEADGIVPTADWLEQAQGRGYFPSDAWNFAIGQGEVTATPLQAANVAATIASGRWAPVTLVRDEYGARIGGSNEPVVSFDERVLATIRAGMWRVVNERGATAFAAKLDDATHVLCGKTGSAQAMPRVINRRWELEWPDGRRASVVAGLEAEDVLARYPRADQPAIRGRFAHDRYPRWKTGDKLPSHAWFIGYTQDKRLAPGAPPRGRVYAIAVLVEYGDSGGRVAGPAAKQMLEYLLSRESAWG